MKGLAVFILLWGVLSSCSRDHSVQISGRVETGDSVVSIWVADSIYAFPVDENHFFSGTITLSQGCYATLLYNSLNLYLAPGEDLSIHVNASNFSGSLYFRGSLGGINSYLKEQEVAVFFDKEYYMLDEGEFIRKMRALIDEKIKLLEAKNFDESFTHLERQRIRYSVAEQVAFYPVYHRKLYPEVDYRPGNAFKDFMSSFALNNEELFGSKDYRTFLLNYFYMLGSWTDHENYSADMADYVLSTITNPAIKDFLLTELVFRYICENNGLAGADRLLAVFRRECSDKSKVEHIESIIAQWEKITPGKPAPDFTVIDRNRKKVSLQDFRGSYLYITVWATWCVPCKSELPYLEWLQRKYYDRNIKFLTVAIDAPVSFDNWKNYLEQHPYAGLHTFADESSEFGKDYMIISVPRFIFISPDGKIINSNAPRLSGQILPYLESFPI